MRWQGGRKKRQIFSLLLMPFPPNIHAKWQPDRVNYIIKLLSAIRHVHYMPYQSLIYFAKHYISRKRISYYKQNICHSNSFFLQNWMLYYNIKRLFKHDDDDDDDDWWWWLMMMMMIDDDDWWWRWWWWWLMMMMMIDDDDDVWWWWLMMMMMMMMMMVIEDWWWLRIDDDWGLMMMTRWWLRIDDDDDWWWWWCW